MNLTRIYLKNENINNEYVSFDNQLDTKYDFDDENKKLIFNQHQAQLMQEMEERMQEYLSDPDLCNDDNDMFPRACNMTGEWYLRSVNFEDDCIFMCAGFIGTDTGKKDDYLGMEVIFCYDEENECFDFDGINTEAL